MIPRRPPLAAAALALVLALTATARAGEDRVAVVVGNNRGTADEIELRFAEVDARRMARVLVDLGGFEAKDVHTVLGQRADAVRDQLVSIAAGHAARQAADEDLDGGDLTLLLYYSGHSDERRLHLDGTTLDVRELQRLLAGSGARLSILVLDACHSGAATRAKGATLGPAYDIEFLAAPDVEGQIVITSSSADEISQESDALEGSFFTHHLVSGLYGAADANGDGLVTLEEAYRHAHFRTVEHTIESRGGVQHPSYRFALSGSGDVVLANLSRATATIEIAASPVTGEYYVLSADRQLVLTEVLPGPGGTASITLPPGSYCVRKREPDRFLMADVETSASSVVRIGDAQMTPVPYTSEGIKGADAEVRVRVHGPRLDVQIRNALAPGINEAWGLRLGYSIGRRHGFVEPRLAARFGTVSVAAGHTEPLTEIDAGAAVGLRNDPATAFRANAAVDLGLVYLHQAATRDITRAVAGAVPLGLQLGVLGRLGFRFTRAMSVHVIGTAGAMVLSVDEVTVVAPSFTIGAGIGLDWGM